MKWLARALVMIALGLGARVAIAHPAVRCAAVLKVDEQRRGTLTLHFDVLSFVLNEEPSKADDAALWRLVDGPDGAIRESLEEAAGRLARHAFVRADGTIVPVRMAAFPSAADLEKWKADVRTPGERPRLPWLADAVLAFDVPPSAGAIGVQFPEVLGDLVLAFESPGREAQAVPLAAGVRSEPFSLRDTGGEEPRHGGFGSFVRLGIEHIVPQGLDHMLFILGLFLASPRVKSLLVMVTMFTLAHSVTLALAATGIVVAPPRVIEPLIALSIAAVAIENIWSKSGKTEDGTHPQTPSLREGAPELRLRAIIVFLFGLVHGLGFASAFKEMELPRSVLVPALVGFNVGVEVGQLIVLCAAFAVIGWAARKSWYRSAVVIPASAAIACVGLYWAVTRMMG
ncbi:MAG: HupE/UreJ family protein [Phycisphaeraceae bacterium]|nr:HupE/UreJ family protein [Phycisphaeraceae bacterium]